MLLISIIIPTYNRSGLIIRSIKSALNQTYQNIEIIVVDDGSTDNTKEILTNYVDKKKIRYFYQENQGPSAARNYAVKQSKGEYLAFLDSDDLWERKKLEKQLKYMRQHPKCSMVIAEGVGIDENGEQYRTFSMPPDNIEQKNLIIDLLFAKIFFFLQAVLIKKSAYIDVGGLDESIIYGEDRLFAMCVAEKHSIGFMQETVFYRQRQDDSLTNTQSEKDILIKLTPMIKKVFQHFPFIKTNKVHGWIASLQAGYCIQNGNRVKSLKYIFRALRFNPANLTIFKTCIALIIPVSKTTLNRIVYWWMSKK